MSSMRYDHCRCVDKLLMNSVDGVLEMGSCLCLKVRHAACFVFTYFARMASML